MTALTLERYLDQVVKDPRAHLKASEITHLRKLDAAGCAMRARGGWVCAGTFYKDATFRRFLQLHLASETFFNGHKIQLNARGRVVIALLAERQRKAG